MLFDYLIPVFLLAGFIYGAYRGAKRELSFFIILSAACAASILLFDMVKDLLSKFINISEIYAKVQPYVSYVNMSEGYLNYLFASFIVFLLINLLLNGLIYLIFFDSMKVKIKVIKGNSRFFGGILGLICGAELSVIMMFFLSGFMKFTYDGPITSILLSNVEIIKNILESIIGEAL